MKIRDITSSKLVAALCILFLLAVLVACGGGGSGARVVSEPAGDACDSASVPVNGVCQPFAIRVDEMAATPFVEDGVPVALEVVLFKPLSGERFPLLVFNHGSTGNGSDPSLFGLTFTHKGLAQFFVERGWMVAFPQRRGRGRSGGLYDEGFKPDRSGYSCVFDLAIAGADRALDDIDAVTDWLRQRPDVDATRMLLGGTSRGGILSVAFLPRRPDIYLGAINFVGGWIGEGCGDYRQINRSLFVAGAAFPGWSLWLYAPDDSFYSLDYSVTNFDAFTAAGGLATFETIPRAPGLNGHFLINDPELWTAAVDDYLGRL